MAQLAHRRGFDVDVSEIESSLRDGIARLKEWKDESSRCEYPTELDPLGIVRSYLCAGLSDSLAEFYASEAVEVCDAMNVCTTRHHVRPGIRSLLSIARTAGIPVAIVSNAHSGRSHRRILKALKLEGFTAEFYSDEVRIRKPHPNLMTMAATALGTTPEKCWYVGDTWDRDVQAGRRAGIGHMFLTRSQHTDHPPFEVADEADDVFEDPRGLVDLLSNLTGIPAPEVGGPEMCELPPPDLGAQIDCGPTHGALLIDHGGVISASQKNPVGINAFAGELAEEYGLPAARIEEALISAKESSSVNKHARDHDYDGTGSLPEVDLLQWWSVHVGRHFSPAIQSKFTGAWTELARRFGAVKSIKTPRHGIRDALEAARDAGLRIIVVSNTISGHAVRATIKQHGLDDLISAYVCSDEYRVRKPDPTLARAALTIADVDPHSAWFVGDKPRNDAWGASLAGIPHRVILRGGSTTDIEIDQFTPDLVTHVCREPAELVDIFTTTRKDTL